MKVRASQQLALDSPPLPRDRVGEDRRAERAQRLIAVGSPRAIQPTVAGCVEAAPETREAVQTLVANVTKGLVGAAKRATDREYRVGDGTEAN
jgi:hypothetical protein